MVVDFGFKCAHYAFSLNLVVVGKGHITSATTAISDTWDSFVEFIMHCFWTILLCISIILTPLGGNTTPTPLVSSPSASSLSPFSPLLHHLRADFCCPSLLADSCHVFLLPGAARVSLTNSYLCQAQLRNWRLSQISLWHCCSLSTPCSWDRSCCTQIHRSTQGAISTNAIFSSWVGFVVYLVAYCDLTLLRP